MLLIYIRLFVTSCIKCLILFRLFLFILLSKPIETPCVWIIEGYIFRLRRHNPTKKTNMCFWYIVLSGWIISLWISTSQISIAKDKRITYTQGSYLCIYIHHTYSSEIQDAQGFLFGWIYPYICISQDHKTTVKISIHRSEKLLENIWFCTLIKLTLLINSINAYVYAQ